MPPESDPWAVFAGLYPPFSGPDARSLGVLILLPLLIQAQCGQAIAQVFVGGGGSPWR